MTLWLISFGLIQALQHGYLAGGGFVTLFLTYTLILTLWE